MYKSNLAWFRPRVAEISLKKPQKCKNSQLIPIVTIENFISPFPPAWGRQPPKKEKTFGTRVRPHAKYGVNPPAGCGEIVDKKKRTNKKNIQ